MNLSFGPLDVLLIIGVSTLVTVVAFVRRPRVKALVFSFPVPFTLATLSLGATVGASHMLGVLNLLLFLNLVRWLHTRARVPIVVSSIISASVYVGIGIVLNTLIPDTTAAFVISSVIAFSVATVSMLAMPAREEPYHRSTLPVPVKFVAVSVVVTCVVILKNLLGGFMTTFPLAGVVTVYETRRSLWTLCRHGTVMVIAIAAMILTMRIAQTAAKMPVYWSLVPGWIAWSLVMVPAMRVRWRREDNATALGSEGQAES